MNAWIQATSNSKNQIGKTTIPPSPPIPIMFPRYCITIIKATPAKILAKSRTESDKMRENSPKK